jgi:hypothetical protein
MELKKWQNDILEIIDKQDKMDKEIAISLAFINLNLIWNKLEFRKRLEPKRSVGIEQQQKDLDHVRMVLNFIISENQSLRDKLQNTEIELMKTQKNLTNYKEVYD